MAAAAAATKTGKIEFIVDQDRPAVTMKRRFDAPRRLVFEAMTRPEHVKRWYGLHGTTVPVCEIDLRPGGAYRIVNRDPQGNEYGFKGVYREIDPPARRGLHLDLRADARQGVGGHRPVRGASTARPR